MPTPAAIAPSTSPRRIRHQAITRTGRPARAIRRMASCSASPIAGVPASICHACIGKGARDVEFLRCRKRDAGRLLAVPQSGVVDRDAPAEAPPLKQRGGEGAAIVGAVLAWRSVVLTCGEIQHLRPVRLQKV